MLSSSSEPAPGCPRCGASIGVGDRFCPRCGGDLFGTPETAPRYAAPPPQGVWTDYGAQVSDWWPRVGAMLLDGVVLFVPLVVLSVVIAVVMGDSIGSAAMRFVATLAVNGAYFGILNGTGSGQTLGNRAAGIAVRDVASDTEIGLGRGVLRWFVRFALYMFAVLPGLLNDLWPLWDRRRQTIADKAARSVMIRLR